MFTIIVEPDRNNFFNLVQYKGLHLMANGITINAFKKFEFLNEHHRTSLAEYGFIFTIVIDLKFFVIKV